MRVVEWLYPDVVAQTLEACEDYLCGRISVSSLQDVIRSAEEVVVAHDEKWLRALLFSIENRIEEIIFTTPSEVHRELVGVLTLNLVERLKSPR
jgi:capsule polysaccharide export protein KpsE/RkpR